MDTTARNNQLIWESFKAGNKEAFAQLYDQYVQVLFRYGTKLCPIDDFVKDAIQEVFLDLYQKRKKNDTNPQNLKYYLILALKRNLIKKLQRKRKAVDDEIDFDLKFEPVYSIESIIIEEEEEKELQFKINEAVRQLPARQKEALYLRFNESLDYTEVAQLLEISVESARKQVYRALKTLREDKNVNTFVFMTLIQKG
ncbi:RNA polymerase sigma factor, sigma-70 family [Tangfeifania diversioriginum]|uniref:RNA polymerase sigma factor, sigma-70 family n=1 Tax=Tangfeifania diversioriginum TaxID=1168035 RepID=A0A1M6MA53_9BACT|nr:sigma-70 family RNA polymerase sigma factor [Tangfeifania diversioriginum]SHJ80173.1 RNA polymerase sigma factor, sigma-70 family [Tangfeifania diversioriginum]